MRPLLVFLVLTLLSACATFEGLSDKRYSGSGDELVNANGKEAQTPVEDGSSVTYTPPPSVVPPGSNVVRPRGTTTQDEQNISPETDLSRSGTVATKGSDSAYYPNAPATPRAYGTTATTPEPYGSPDIESPTTSSEPPVTVAGSSTGTVRRTVRPKTTLVATPETYRHLEEDAMRAVDPAFAAALTGLWENTTDSEETVEFTTDHYTTFYSGEMLLREPMTVHKRCPGDCNGGNPMDISCFTIVGPAGIDCFAIIRLSTIELELQLIGVSPTTVTYRRQ